uniref:hypothetical protein n=1 Tax=Candidatus Electrothrix sp. TaxID=2170559 RepID=UPI0040563E11
MILTDTGPLIALLDKRDNHHKRCIDAVKTLPAEAMLTTWPCFTEAMHMIRKAYAFWKAKPMHFVSQKACCLVDGRGRFRCQFCVERCPGRFSSSTS